MISKRSYSRGGEMPIAMSRAFSQNTKAADSFTAMSSHSKQRFIDNSFSSINGANMSAYIDRCSDHDNNISYSDDQIYY